ncbi:asparagine synthase (glutamine-hydrolyzing) [Bacillus smithii]|uniref:asparagine synthase (glutamine-hydrolyzing) n=1 Tax=Bacillus smithii TaxID=1479 RepID=UPI0030C99A2B
MCGITGWADFKKNLRPFTEQIVNMTETLQNRGPDQTNYFQQDHLLFGHKRLIVVDPDGGRQPMTKTHNERTYTIIYNGELYNTEDIRKVLLSKGYAFQGHSDTEVLLTSFIEWKEDCLEYLNGIFAFAIWDHEKEKLFLARDRVGVKPLFYTLIGSSFVFGSEIKAILAHSDTRAEIDREGLAEVMGLGPARIPGSGVFRNIKELKPGHALTFSKEGLNNWRYWNVKSDIHQDSMEETIEKVRFLVQDAVTRQLVSDVPLCTFLSGGVDSSAITAIASHSFTEQQKGTLHTYSIDYEENDQFFQANDFQPNADGPWIKLVSDHLGTIHHNCVISQETLKNYLPAAVHARDLPGMADVDSSLLWFSQEIKKSFVVGLSGECADEIFGGYPWFHRSDDFNREGFPWMRATNEREQLLNDEWRKKLNLKEFVLHQYREAVKEVPVLEGENSIDARRRELFYLNLTWFMPVLLDRKDRMSMGASLEVRVPYADHRLVEYVWNIPWEMKMYGNREKGLLRKALEGILPEEVLYRKKSPYPKTHHPGYTKIVKEWVSQLLEDRSSIMHELLDKKTLEELVETEGRAFQVPWYGQLMTGPQLLAHLGQIHVWFQDYHIQIVDR